MLVPELTEFILRHQLVQGALHTYCSCGRWYAEDIFNDRHEYANHLAREITRTYRIGMGR